MSNHVQNGPLLLEQVKLEDADGIVYDPMCLWGRSIADQLELPKALFYSGIVIRPDSPVMRFLSTIQGGLPAVITSMFSVKEALSLVPIPREFQPPSKYLDETYEFIGPTIIQPETDHNVPVEKLKEQSTLYISLGSVINHPQFYQLCIDAFANTDWEVIMVAKTISEQTKIPDNFTILPFAPQLDILPHANIFISHGGVNSVMESLWFGVPLVMVPQSSDQPVVAARVAEMGLGITLDNKALTSQQLREAVAKVNFDTGLKRRVEEMQSILHKQAGATRGADLLQQYVTLSAITK